MRVFLAAVFACVLLSFSKEDTIEVKEDFVLKVEVLGAWCGTTKTISITDRQTKISFIGGNCKEKDSSSIYPTDTTKLFLLKNKLEELKFRELDLNECFRCVDGTDYKITLDEKGKVYSNTIAYRYDKENMTPIEKQLKELQDILNSF